MTDADTNGAGLKPPGREAGGRREFRDFSLFLAIHFVVWVLVPLARNVPHYDSTEALAWGLTWEWGTNKHPPLSGWLAEIAFRLSGDRDLGIYVLAQICVIIAFVFIHRLAREFAGPGNAFFCVVFLEGSIYYSLDSSEYNVNVLSLAVVPAAVWFSFRAARTGRSAYWLLTGVCGGLALLTKYTNGIALLSLAIYFLAVRPGRERLKTPGPWLAAATAAILFLPHALWLASHDFLPLEYSRARSLIKLDFFAGHALEPLKLFFAQILNSLPALALFFYLYLKTPPDGRGPGRRPDPFLFCAGLLPLLLMVGMVAAAGMNAATKWAYAFTGYFPLLLFAVFPVSPPPGVRRRSLGLSGAVMALYVLGYLGKVFVAASASTNLDARAFADLMRREWNATSSAPIRRVGGALHLVSRTSAYMLPERPRPFFLMDKRVTVWEDEDEMLADGILVMAHTREEYAEYRSRYPDLPEARHIVFPVRSLFGRERAMDVYCGALPPKRSG